MGKPSGKKKIVASARNGDSSVKQRKRSAEKSSKAFDEETTIFINMSHELKEEGTRLFQKRDQEGALLKYEKALKLLPRNHIDVSHLRCNMAACYMQMGVSEYPSAINQCNLALEVSPKYCKALLKRARCYEALNRFELALRDVNSVLTMEPNNLTAMDISESVKSRMMEMDPNSNDNAISLEQLENVADIPIPDGSKENSKNKKKKKKKIKNEKGAARSMIDKAVVGEKVVADIIKDNELLAKTIEEEKFVTESGNETKLVSKTVKLVHGEDIRCAQLPINCNIGLVRDVIHDRFPSLTGVLMKYRDAEGDLVTITTMDELRMAESSGDMQGSFRLYIVEVSRDQEPNYEHVENENKEAMKDCFDKSNTRKIGEAERGRICIDDWIIQFAQLFKNHVGFDSDSCLDLHELGMKVYAEAMEDTVTSEEAQKLFEIAAGKFQEMAALAYFNWGNVHMSKARKRAFLSENDLKEAVLLQVNNGYEWAKEEYVKAGSKYQEAVKIKPDFYEGFLALGQQQFEQARLCWYHAIGIKIESENEISEEVLNYYNKAEDNFEMGIQMWEEIEEQRLNGISKFDEYKEAMEKLGFGALVKDVLPDEASGQAANMSSQIYLLWGTMLYERSVVEYKLGILTWEECLEVAVEKFELAGASQTDVAVMIKNHCSNETSLDGMGFKIDEIVQAWNDMYDAKRWETGIPSFRLEPLFHRRVPKLYHIFEQI